jgi:P-type Cu+ transporter
VYYAIHCNVAVLPLAAIGVLNPVVASLAMVFSSISVVGNALRLRRFKTRRAEPVTRRPPAGSVGQAVGTSGLMLALWWKRLSGS